MVMILVSVSCGKDDPKPKVDEVEATVEALSNKPWTPTGVTFANANVDTDWSNFVLSFDDSKGYTASALSNESVLVWPASGTYTFPNANDPNTILRDDGVLISIQSLTETSTLLVFTITGRNEDTRTEGLLGKWEFELGN